MNTVIWILATIGAVAVVGGALLGLVLLHDKLVAAPLLELRLEVERRFIDSTLRGKGALSDLRDAIEALQQDVKSLKGEE